MTTDASPPRLSFTNLPAHKEVTCQFNPAEWDEEIAPQFARLAPQGLSHEVHHFDHTSPYTLRFTLRFQAMDDVDLLVLRRARRNLLSWAYPRKIATGQLGGGPPPILVVWPRMLAVETFMTSLRIRHERFNSLGDSVLFTADVAFEEKPETLITFEEVELPGKRLGDR